MKPRGFCAGVVRAINSVERALKIWGAPIYVKHQIVHNKHVIKSLEDKGAIFVDDLDKIPRNSIVIYSAHGVSPSVRRRAKDRNLIEIDASCGLVTRVHSAIKRFAKKGYHIIIIGDRNHIEVIGAYGEAVNDATIVESVEDVKLGNIPEDRKLFYVTQTTLSIDDAKEISDALKKKYPHIETLRDSFICFATQNRQLAVKEIANLVDLILVIGDPSSSNSNRLCEVALKQSVYAYLINDPYEIDNGWFNGVKSIGITAGASTPEYLVKSCIDYLSSRYPVKIREVIYKEEDVVFQLPKEVL